MKEPIKISDVHVAEVATSDRALFLYTHYQDVGHAPSLTVVPEGDGGIRIDLRDTFKLKPNNQVSPKNRIDLYISYGAARQLCGALRELAGSAAVPAAANTDPEGSRTGPKTLPLIHSETLSVSCESAGMWIADASVYSQTCKIYMEQEAPHQDHGVMVEKELHLGVALSGNVKLNSTVDRQKITLVTVPDAELKAKGETNPVRKSSGLIRIRLTGAQGASLAAAVQRLSEDI